MSIAASYDGREIVSITEAMGRVHVSRRTIYNWLAAGRLEYVRTAGGAVRIYADTLIRKEPHDYQRTP
jgi:excisionase family DNA binding protein